MDSALAVHRLHFAFTVTFHYLFPQLTMGLALLIVILKTAALRTGNASYNEAARFWMKIFAINFAMGVVTGIPMEFQFGTNWAKFSNDAGGVIGQTLAMEGVTDAWMQHPAGFRTGADGKILLDNFWGLVLNPWILWQYLHNMIATVVTGSFVVAAIGAYYLLMGKFQEQARIFVRTGVIAGAIALALLLFPTGDGQGRMIADHQPVTLAAMEGLFDTTQGAPIAILGQPDTQKLELDNPLLVPRALSFLTYRRWSAAVKGLKDFPRDLWPDNIPLLYYSYHIMVGLGTLLILLAALSVCWLWRGRLYACRPLLWALMLALPFPYIATTAGWMTAELGRQPWLIYGLMRTAEGASPRVSASNGLFTLIGFMGMYFLLGVLFLFLVSREIGHGPGSAPVEVAESVR
jgi:cytochrome bd ubiquinol oxidase subunit I